MRLRIWRWVGLCVVVLCLSCSSFEPVPRARGAAASGNRVHVRPDEGTEAREPQGGNAPYGSGAPAGRRTWSGLSNEQILALANEIKAFLGAPYLWGGSSPEGVDCSGFVYAVFRRAWGLTLPRSTEGMRGVGDLVDKDSLRFSDLVFFEAPGVRQASHVGIYVAKGLFVHASPTKGVVLSDLEEEYFRQHYAGARRLIRYVAQ